LIESGTRRGSRLDRLEPRLAAAERLLGDGAGIDARRLLRGRAFLCSPGH